MSGQDTRPVRGRRPAGVEPGHELRRIRLLQFAQAGVIAVAVVVFLVAGLVLRSHVEGARAEGERVRALIAGLSSIDADMRDHQTRVFLEREQGGTGITPALIVAFLRARADATALVALQARDPGTSRRERAAAAAYLAAYADLAGRLIPAQDAAPASVTDRIEAAWPVVFRLEDTSRRWMAALFGRAQRAAAEQMRAQDTMNQVMLVLAACLGVSGLAASLLLSHARRRYLGIVAGRERRFRALARHASDAVVVVGEDGVVSYASESVEAVLGWRAEDVVGRPVTERVHPADRARLERLLQPDASAAEADVRLRRPDGGWTATEIHASDGRTDRAVEGWILNVHDVSAQVLAQSRLEHQAFHDGLTGLANRQLFEDRAAHALRRAEREGGMVGVILLDLDDFKTVNDGLGHEAGDQLLREVADAIRETVRASDTAARLGGDEFCVLVERLGDEDEATTLAGRLLGAVQRLVRVQDREVMTAASAGIALSAPGDSPRDLLRNADIAMYAAKGSGKGRARVFAPEMHAQAERRMRLSADLRRGLRDAELVLEYQPIVRLADQAVVGAEALVRWDPPDRPRMAPVEFLPLAEETGLIVPLGRWVLGEACRQLAELRRLPGGGGLYVSVNVSARQLEHDGLFEEVASALASAGIPGEALVLEITESVFLAPEAPAVGVLERVRRLGVRVAIDDFGTGYSSLSYIRDLPVDMVKVDKSFVDPLAGEGGGEVRLAAVVVQLARALGLGTIAEGVEHDRQAEHLHAMGCGHGQGYRFSPPLAPPALRELLAVGVAPCHHVPEVVSAEPALAHPATSSA